ncbi:hypothetical protein ACQEU3_36670 [Spirillospora sp. CA-253888]
MLIEVALSDAGKSARALIAGIRCATATGLASRATAPQAGSIRCQSAHQRLLAGVDPTSKFEAKDGSIVTQGGSVETSGSAAAATMAGAIARVRPAHRRQAVHADGGRKAAV